MALKLNTKLYDRLYTPVMAVRLARHLKCSVAAVKMMRYRDGYGARSDGQKRVVRVNRWLLKEAGK